MVFTERQREEIKRLVKDVSKEVLQEMLENKKFVEKMSETLADKLSEKLLQRVEDLSSQINKQTDTIKTIQGEYEELSLKVEELEQKTNNCKLRFYGVKHENVDTLKDNIQNIIGMKIGVPDVRINACYRINSGKSRHGGPVIVVFDSLAQRNSVYFNKKKLKGSNIMVTEELTKSRYELLLFAKEKLGRSNTWTIEGQIYSWVNEKKCLIKCEEDVRKLC